MTNLRERFIRALRSGLYRQTHGALASGGVEEPTCFCAEGLLCHLVNPVWHRSDYYNIWEWTSSSGNIHGGLAPVDFIEKLYLPLRTSLHNLNDSKRLSFPQIADILDPQKTILP